MSNSVNDILSQIIELTLYKLKSDKNVIWIPSDLYIKYVTVDTSTGMNRLIIDATYKPNNYHMIRIYVYIATEYFSDPIDSDTVIDNNEPYNLFVHSMTMRDVDFASVVKAARKYNFVDRVLYAFPSQECGTIPLVYNSPAIPVNAIPFPTNGSRSCSTLYVNGLNYFMVGGWSTAETTINRMAMNGPSLPDTSTAISQVYAQVYNALSGCAIGTKMFFTKTPTSIAWLQTTDSNAFGSTTVTQPIMLRADADDNLWLLKYFMAGITLYSVNTTTLIQTAVPMVGDVPAGTVESGFCKDGYFYISTNLGLFKVQTSTGASDLITTGWLDSALGYVDSTFLRKITLHSDGSIIGILANPFGSKYLVKMEPSGELMRAPIELSSAVDYKAVPVEISPETIIVMSVSISGVTVQQVNLVTGVVITHAEGSPIVSVAYNVNAFIATDGRVYLPTNDGGNMPYVERCPEAIPFSNEQKARVQSYELNYF